MASPRTEHRPTDYAGTTASILRLRAGEKMLRIWRYARNVWAGLYVVDWVMTATWCFVAVPLEKIIQGRMLDLRPRTVRRRDRRGARSTIRGVFQSKADRLCRQNLLPRYDVFDARYFEPSRVRQLFPLRMRASASHREDFWNDKTLKERLYRPTGPNDRDGSKRARLHQSCLS